MADALLVMLVGMGGVFIFLLVLIGLMQALVRLFPQKIPVRKPMRGPRADADDELIAVLQAAVHVYEMDRKQ